MSSRRRRLGAVLGVIVAAAAGCDRTVADGKADGPAVFAEACARCHGPGGVPDASMVAQLGVKDLTAPHMRQLSDDDLRRQIKNGSANRRMPAFSGALTDAQVDALVAYLRSLPAR